MGLFNSKKEGGVIDSIRCDEKDFLIWKWRPNSSNDANSSNKENAIRYGSSLRVKPGQAAIFLYQNKGEYDVVFGPFDDIIKAENLPVLASIVGLAYKGGTPFQAEVYFIDLAKGMEIPFVVPYFRVIPSESEYKVYDIQVAIKGCVTFEIPKDSQTIKYLFEAWGANDTPLKDFQAKVKTLIVQEVKRVFTNAPKDTGIFILHFNSLIGEIGNYVLHNIQQPIAHRFGVYASGVLIEDIRYNEDNDSYQRLKRITEEQTQLYNLENEKTALLSFEIKRQTMQTDADVRNENVRRMAEIQMENVSDTALRMREEAQFAQHKQSEQAARQTELQSESAYINAHAIDKQSDVLKAGMESLGQMSAMNFGGNGGGMNPAGMMTGMMMGTAMGGQAANMMNQMGQIMNTTIGNTTQSAQTPPPIPGQQITQFYLAINGQQFGPCHIDAIRSMMLSGQINGETLGWCEGMPNWIAIRCIPALATIFTPSGQNTPPPIPNIPPIPNN